MNDLRIQVTEKTLLAELFATRETTIIWDANAFYFNSRTATYKLECLACLPDGSAYQYDELFFLRFKKLAQHQYFKVNAPGYWYKIVADSTRIKALEIVETTVLFPEDELADATGLVGRTTGINKVWSGLLITTAEGVLPALLLPSNYGFMWLTKRGFYSRDEVDSLLTNEIEKYDLRQIISDK